MAELTKQPMATIVNWFMILIIFVFDPLAIAMVVAANMAFAHVKGVARDPKDYEVYEDTPVFLTTDNDVEVFVEAIGNPQPPNEVLIKAAEKHSEEVITKPTHDNVDPNCKAYSVKK
jgi:hypothetical protein